MAAPISSSVNHRTTNVVVNHHEQCYLMSELESLGLSTIQLNEFNNNEELRNLVYGIKKQSESPTLRDIVKKMSIEHCIEELRSLAKIQEYGACSDCGKPFEEVMGSCRGCGAERPDN